MNRYFPNIKALRLQNNYKQEYVADILGLSQPEYSKLENGFRKVDMTTLRELCKLYDVEMDQLLSQQIQSIQMLTHPELAASMQPQHNESVIQKLMDNYASLLENLVRQQQTHDKLIDRLIGENSPSQRPAA
ncbi:MAG: helix-turn-helix domain-containing protein [Flavobacteriales bacterium]